MSSPEFIVPASPHIRKDYEQLDYALHALDMQFVAGEKITGFGYRNTSTRASMALCGILECGTISFLYSDSE